MKTKGPFQVINLSAKIRIAAPLVRQIQYLVKTVSTECQWFHLVERKVEGNSIIFELTEMFIPPQTVTAATVESPEAGMSSLFTELVQKYGGFVPAGEKVRAMQCWAHSHVNMESSPSGTDQTNFQELITANKDSDVPVIMMITNKRDEVYFRVADPVTGLDFLNPPIEIVDLDVDTSYIDEAIKSKIVKQTFAPTYIKGGLPMFGTGSGSSYVPKTEYNKTENKGNKPSAVLKGKVNRKTQSFSHLKNDTSLINLLKDVSKIRSTAQDAEKLGQRTSSYLGNAAACFDILLRGEIPSSRPELNMTHLNVSIETIWSGGIDEYIDFLAASLVLYENYSNEDALILHNILNTNAMDQFLAVGHNL